MHQIYLSGIYSQGAPEAKAAGDRKTRSVRLGPGNPLHKVACEVAEAACLQETGKSHRKSR